MGESRRTQAASNFGYLGKETRVRKKRKTTMSKVYAKFEVQLHGLDVRSEAEMEFLRSNVAKSLRMMGFAPRSEDDVVVELVESAGEYDG